jgi:hypothetical protein
MISSLLDVENKNTPKQIYTFNKGLPTLKKQLHEQSNGGFYPGLERITYKFEILAN